MSLSVLQRVSADDIVKSPFPHLVVENALPAELFARLQATYPSLQQVSGQTSFENNTPYLASAHTVLDEGEGYPALWREFFSYHTSSLFHADIARVWEAAITAEYAQFASGRAFSELRLGIRTSKEEARLHDLVYDCQFVMNSPVRSESSVRTPHIDSTHTLVAAILYFREPDDDSRGGDLELYRLASASPVFDKKRFIEHRYIERFKVVRYAPNTLVMWLNTNRSIHGVSPRSMTSRTRQFVNFIVESYSLAPNGFFTLPVAMDRRWTFKRVAAAALRRSKLINSRAERRARS